MNSILRTTVKYYKKGKITLEEATEDLNMTVEEFKEEDEPNSSRSSINIPAHWRTV